MFGAKYRYDLNETKGTITLRPTKGLVVASFAPTFLILGGLYAIGTYVEKQEKRKLTVVTNPETK